MFNGTLRNPSQNLLLNFNDTFSKGRNLICFWLQNQTNLFFYQLTQNKINDNTSWVRVLYNFRTSDCPGWQSRFLSMYRTRKAKNILLRTAFYNLCFWSKLLFDPNCILLSAKDFKYTLSVIKCMHQNLQWKTLWNKTSSFCILVDWYVKDHTMGWNYFCRSNLSYIGLKNIWDVIQISIWNSKIKK